MKMHQTRFVTRGCHAILETAGLVGLLVQIHVGGPLIAAGSAPDAGPPPPSALPDFHADPHIAVFGNTYYLYPTTDMRDWNSPSFECWSSKDLKHWTNEGIILHFPRDLKWAKSRAWAPCIASRNGKYYFYFSAEQNIGVAVGTRPQGPFQDPLGRPLITKDSYQCQVIDPMVFIDDDGSAYLYFGQGNCNVVKLNEDMVSFDPNAVKRITPRGYNEGAFVLKRKGVYYLMWSQYDTRDPRYCVSYASASSPLGPFTNAANNPILVQSGPVKGAGHHSVAQIPGRDEWVMAYHRFHIPDGDGYHREICLSPMRFNAQGQIEKVNVFESVAPLEFGGNTLPGLRQLMNTPLRDTSICRRPDGTWYLTGTVYLLWHSGKIARMKPDMSGLAEPCHWLKTTVLDPNPKHHSSLCAGIFGSDEQAPWQERPGVFPITFDATGHIWPKML